MASFSEHLLEQRLLDAQDLTRAQEVSARTGLRLPAALARLGLVAEADIASALAAVHDLQMVSAADIPPLDPETGYSFRFLAHHRVAPIASEGDRLILAMADPEDEAAARGMAFAAGVREILPRVATFSDIDAHLGPVLHASAETPADGGSDEDFERIFESESEAPVIRLVQRLLEGAVDRRASDLHIEPMARFVSVRYRVDGRLVEVERHPAALAAPMATRIKVLAGLDIAESRLPQDGRLRLTARGREVDVRVSTSPIAHGESIVLRLLGRTEVPLELDLLGLPPAALARLELALARPHGIILLTGPTGSGKTTTLYAAINRLRRPEVKILTVEDPVEVLLEGVNQVQVRPEIELSYAATLRAFLRQDPDILMIGEIRDLETAEIALRAALTGHLVLSTLHTNSALGAFTRLADIGIEPYLAASTVVATIAQRLIRGVCGECAGTRAPTADEIALFASAEINAPAVLAVPAGCPRCSETGYRGRLPLIEVVSIDERIQAAVREGRVEEIEAGRARADTLLGHGLALAAAGRTSLEEVRRAVELA
ncbi:MAG TPA: ATPase, T2SS/T4P/T4SS family [Allosphingosinicella sp.]